MDSTPHGGASIPTGRDKVINAHVTQPHHDQSISENSKAGEAPNLGNQEAKRERSAPSKGHPLSPNQVPDMDLRHEQRPSSGFRKNGNRNRFGRGHESQGDWKSPGQDTRHYNQPANRERQGQNMHYEYHPDGPYDNSKTDNFQRPKDGNHTARGRRKREKKERKRRERRCFEEGAT